MSAVTDTVPRAPAAKPRLWRQSRAPLHVPEEWESAAEPARPLVVQ
jgi:hypothetical protein